MQNITREQLLAIIDTYIKSRGEHTKGNSWRSIATESDVPYHNLIDFKRGRPQMPSQENLKKLLMLMRPDLVGNGEHVQIPIKGYVGAGAAVHSVDEFAHNDGLGFVDCPPNMNPKKTVALLVKGDSMEPVFSDGWVLYYDQRAWGVPVEFISWLCVVKLEDGRTLVKKIFPGTQPGLYNLYSFKDGHDVIKDAMVEWSAKVRFMGQR